MWNLLSWENFQTTCVVANEKSNKTGSVLCYFSFLWLTHININHDVVFSIDNMINNKCAGEDYVASHESNSVWKCPRKGRVLSIWKR